MKRRFIILKFSYIDAGKRMQSSTKCKIKDLLSGILFQSRQNDFSIGFSSNDKNALITFPTVIEISFFDSIQRREGICSWLNSRFRLLGCLLKVLNLRFLSSKDRISFQPMLNQIRMTNVNDVICPQKLDDNGKLIDDPPAYGDLFPNPWLFIERVIWG